MTAEESVESRLAASVGRTPAPAGKRVRQISFKARNETWTMTVGEQPRGTRPEHSRRKGQLTTTILQLADTATVLAIFAGDPFIVVTDAGAATDVDAGLPSRFPSPLAVPRASGVRYFPA